MPQTAAHCSIEEMQSASQAAGWDIRYTQIAPGRPLNSYSETDDRGKIVLMDEFVDRQIEVIGAAPDGCVTVLAACGSTKAWLNGEFFDSSTIMLFKANAETHLVSYGPIRVLSMHIPNSLLSASDFVNGRSHTTGSVTQTTFLNLGQRDSEHLRRLMHASIHAQNTPHQQLAQEVALADLIHQALLLNKVGSAGKRRITSKMANAKVAKKTIDDARDFIDANLHRPMAMNDVAVSAAASISKLERVFKQHLGLTPSYYIRARRLSVARSALQAAPYAREQVARIALDCGFTHLGRFSQFYRMQFGEPPSTTLATRKA